MTRSIPVLTILLVASAFCLDQGAVQAQYNPYANNPYLLLARTQANLYAYQNQSAIYNQRLLTNYLSTGGASAYAGYYPSYYPNYYTPAYGGAVNPYVANPYTPTAPAYGSGYGNPYSPTGVDPAAANPYSPYNGYNPYNPYSYGPGYGAGSALMGQADVIRANGKLVNDWEDARLKREIALQAKLDTKKKKFELDMYIRANTLTYTQEQQIVAKNTLERIQTNALPSEIASGKALNLIIKDLERFPNKKISMEPIALSDAVLTHLNVTSQGTYGVGLLREGGKVSFPLAVQERMTAERRQTLEKQLQHLVKEANNGRKDAVALKDAGDEINRLLDELVKKVNDIPTGQYLEGKRFLQELEKSLGAIQNGQAITQSKYQRWVEEGKGGRSVQEVADYMIERGLRFGPATGDDEAAYRAVHAAMASYDIAMNTQLGGGAKE